MESAPDRSPPQLHRVEPQNQRCRNPSHHVHGYRHPLRQNEPLHPPRLLNRPTRVRTHVLHGVHDLRNLRLNSRLTIGFRFVQIDVSFLNRRQPKSCPENINPPQNTLARRRLSQDAPQPPTAQPPTAKTFAAPVPDDSPADRQDGQTSGRTGEPRQPRCTGTGQSSRSNRSTR